MPRSTHKAADDSAIRKQAEEALRASEQRYKQSLGNNPYPMWVLDLETLRFLAVNAAAMRDYGYSREEFLTITIKDICPPQDIPRLLQELLKIPEGLSNRGRWRHRKKNGAIIEVEITTHAVLLSGRPARIVLAKDITEPQRTEEELQESEERFRRAFAEAAVGLAIMDRNGRFLQVNRAYCDITGYTAEELQLTASGSITHSEDLDRNVQLIRQLLAGEIESFVIQKRYIRKSGSTVWVQNSVSVVRDHSGTVVNLIALTEDISERKQAEETLRQLSGRLLRLQDEERQRIARELHDSTAQNLVALGTNLAQLRGSARGQKSRKILSQSEELLGECLREVRTISYLLHPPMLDETGLEDAVRHYVEGFAARSGIRVKLEWSRSAGRLPREAELALFRVVQESLINIHHHSGSPQAKIRMNREPGRITLEIRDAGRGIRPGSLNRAGTSAVGFGVGIASMQERMKQLGGRLEIDSGKGGTTIRAIVPLGGTPT